MNNFAAFIKLEWRRFYKSMNIVIVAVLLLLLAIFTKIGISEYHDLVDRQQQFQKIEALNFKKFPNYDTYGDEGVSVQYCPGPTGIFFRNIGVSTELIGKFDSIVNISIFDNYKSRSLFRGMFAGIWSFAGVIFVFGSLICLFFAAGSLRKIEYNKFLCTLLPRWKVFCFSVSSQLLLITFVLLFIFLSMYFLLAVNGIRLTPVDLSNLTDFALSTSLMLFFFFFIGIILGIIRSKTGGFLAIMVAWISFVFLIPGIKHYVVEQNTFGSIKDYQTEIEKFRIVADFENRATEEYGSKFNGKNIELAREIMEKYFAIDYLKIEVLEERLKDEIQKNIGMLDKFSILTPPSFYYLTAIEVSSRGYRNFLDFYAYLLRLRRKFVRFYIDRFYYHDPTEMINFIEEKENLYFAQSRVPESYETATFICSLTLFILFFFSYFCFRRSLYRIDEKDIERFARQDLDFHKGKVTVIEVENTNFKNLLYNLLSGAIKTKKLQQCPGKILLNGENLLLKTGKTDFIFLSGTEALPEEIKVKDFLKFMTALIKLSSEKKTDLFNRLSIKTLLGRKFKTLNNHKRGLVLLELSTLIKSPFYFFFDTALGLTVDFAVPFKEKLETLKENASVLYLTTNDYVKATRVEKGKSFLENPTWLDQVDYMSRMQK